MSEEVDSLCQQCISFLLEDPLCIHSFIVVGLTGNSRTLRKDGWTDRQTFGARLTWMSSPPSMNLVVVSFFPLSFLVKAPFRISPSWAHAPCKVTSAVQALVSSWTHCSCKTWNAGSHNFQWLCYFYTSIIAMRGISRKQGFHVPLVV